MTGEQRPTMDTTGDALRRDDTQTLGMWLFIASLSVLFIASMVGYLVVRLRAPEWPPAGMPALPRGLYFSTFVLIASSMTMHFALHSVRRGRAQLLRMGLAATFVLGAVFLISQVSAWSVLLAADVYAQANLYAFTFYMLTGLHALHVIGGLIPLGVIMRAAWRGAYSPLAHQPVKNTAMYWHFLDIVWLVMFVLLITAG